MSEPDPEVTPEQEAHLRRLLAEARHADPIPVDVAARLDRVLEQLAAEGPADAAEQPGVVDLGARRRRRVGALLAAAVVVVLVGVGLGQVLDQASSQGDSSSAAGGAADDTTAAESAPEASTLAGDAKLGAAGPDDTAPSQAPAPGTGTESGGEGWHRLVRLDEKTFARRVVRLSVEPGYEATAGTRVKAADLSSSESFLCPPADWGTGTLFAALYDGLPTVLAFREPTGSTRTVDLLRCGTGEVLRSTVLAVS